MWYPKYTYCTVTYKGFILNKLVDLLLLFLFWRHGPDMNCCGCGEDEFGSSEDLIASCEGESCGRIEKMSFGCYKSPFPRD